LGDHEVNEPTNASRNTPSRRRKKVHRPRANDLAIEQHHKTLRSHVGPCEKAWQTSDAEARERSFECGLKVCDNKCRLKVHRLAVDDPFLVVLSHNGTVPTQLRQGSRGTFFC
jgi:hypothetical protein